MQGNLPSAPPEAADLHHTTIMLVDVANSTRRWLALWAKSAHITPKAPEDRGTERDALSQGTKGPA